MKAPVKVLASARSHETLDSIRSVLGGVSGIRLELRNGALSDLLQDTLLDRRSQLMILDVNLESDSELETLHQIIDQVPSGLPIIATSNVSSLERVRLLMRLGLADFVPQPIIQEDLLNSIEIAGRQLERGGVVAKPGRSCGRVPSTLRQHGRHHPGRAIGVHHRAEAGPGTRSLPSGSGPAVR